MLITFSKLVAAGLALILAACTGSDLLPSPDSPDTPPAVTSPSQGGQEQPSSSGTSSSSSSPGPEGQLSQQEAESIALEHAGLKTADAARLKTERDNENGVPVYEIEFWNGDREYEYSIEISSGAVLKVEQELHRAKDAPGGKEIGEQAAQNAALSHAGLLDKDGEPRYGMSWITIRLEYEDGLPEVYEVEFETDATRTDGIHCEYEIGYSSGTVYSFKREVLP